MGGVVLTNRLRARNAHLKTAAIRLFSRETPSPTVPICVTSRDIPNLQPIKMVLMLNLTLEFALKMDEELELI
jgi:hypothetical protein